MGSGCLPALDARSTMSRWNSVRNLHHFTSHGHELFSARTWNDDGVTTAMRFLSDSHKPASFVFSKFNEEMLTFDLEFFRNDDVVHDYLEGCRWKP